MSALGLLHLRLALWMERRRRDVLLSEQHSFALRTHETHVALKVADHNIVVLRRRLDLAKRGRPEGRS